MPHAWEEAIIHFLSNLFQTIDWAGVVVIMTLESANIPIPSEVTMPLAGWLLAENLFELDYGFSATLWLAGPLVGVVFVGLSGMAATWRF